jgi:hypothetical protein
MHVSPVIFQAKKKVAKDLRRLAENEAIAQERKTEITTAAGRIALCIQSAV